MDDDPSSEQTEPAAEGPVASGRTPDWPPPSQPGYGPPPGWWQTPDGRWQPPPWQPPPGWWQTPDGQWQPPAWQQPPSGQPQSPWRQPSVEGTAVAPSPQARQPYGTWPAGTPAPADDGQVFGATRGPRPGRVPWRGRDVLFAVLIAAAPIAILSVLGTISSGSSAATSQKPTAAFALAAIVSTVLVDGWLVFWAWFFSLRKYRLSLTSYGFRGFEEASSWAVAAAVIVGGVLATTVLGTVSDYAYRKIIGPVPKENVVTIFPHTSAGVVLFIVLAVLVAPLLEETFFRGFVFQGLARSWGPLAGALTSALIFAAWHQQLSVLIPICGLGILLAAVFYWTKSIYSNIAFHAVFNAFGIVAWWFVTKG